jgi:hypothetical protein
MANVENYAEELKPVAHPGPPPNITILTEAAGQRAMAAYEARHDAHVAWVMSRPAGSWSAEEKQAVLGQILRSGRDEGWMR